MRELAEARSRAAAAAGAPARPIAPQRRRKIQQLVRAWAAQRKRESESVFAHLATPRPLLLRPGGGRSRGVQRYSFGNDGGGSSSAGLAFVSNDGGGGGGGGDAPFRRAAAAAAAAASSRSAHDTPLLRARGTSLARRVDDLRSRVRVFQSVEVLLSATGGGRIAHAKEVRRLRTQRAAAAAAAAGAARGRERRAERTSERRATVERRV